MNFKNILSNEIKHAILHNNHIEEKEIWDDYLKSKSRKRSRARSDPSDFNAKISKYMEIKEREIRRKYKIENEQRIIEKKKSNAKTPNIFDWTGVSEKWTHDLYENQTIKTQVIETIELDEDSPLNRNSSNSNILDCCDDKNSENSSSIYHSTSKIKENSSNKSVKHKKKSKKKKNKKAKSRSPSHKKKKHKKRDSSEIIWVE